MIENSHWLGSMENVSKDQNFELPAGFRFHPTDEELINQYLIKKVADSNFSAIAIAEVDMNKCEPWDLPGYAKMGEAEWYFFCVRDKKYPTGLRANRATDSGYWKATGKDKEVIKETALIGMKKTLVFYKGRAPKGEKTNWVMHEYRLEGTKYSEYNLSKQGKSEWVICRVYVKSPYGKKTHVPKFGPSPAASLLPPLTDSSPYNSETITTVVGELSQVTCFSDPNQTQNQKTKDDNNIVDSKETPSSRPFDVSPFAIVATPAVSNQQSTQIAHQIENSQYSDSFLGMLMENNGSSAAKQNQKADFSLGRDFDDVDISSVINNTDMFQRWLGNQEHSSASVGPLDIDCLWNY